MVLRSLYALALVPLAIACAREPEPVAELSTPLRRLTAEQTRNALRDLFPELDLSELPLRLPADAAVDNFENTAAAQTPSFYLVERHQQIFLQVAAELTSHHAEVLPCDLLAEPNTCAHDYLDELAARAWRRPLSNQESKGLRDFYDHELALAGTPEPALQLAVQRVLLAPHFVYLVERGSDRTIESSTRRLLSSHELATRLALLLWNTIPDDELLAAAARDELSNEAAILAQAERMLADPRARAGVLAFYRQWLGFDSLQAVRDRKLPPEWLADPEHQHTPAWDESLVAQMRHELDAFVTEVHFGGDEATLARLLGSRRSLVSPQLAVHYGVQHPISSWDPPAPGEEPPGSAPIEELDWAWVELPEDQRAGVLTLAGPMTMLALDRTPSPIRRGVFVLDNLLCAPPSAPPPQIDTTLPASDDADDLPRSNRERFAEHTDNPICAGCHASIDAIGFGFEHYDQTGWYRTLDGGWPVDASGEALGHEFQDAVELMQQLGSSEAIHRCFAQKWWGYALGRSREQIADDPELEQIADEFWANGGRLEQLLLLIVSSEEFRTLAEEQAP